MCPVYKRSFPIQNLINYSRPIGVWWEPEPEAYERVLDNSLHVHPTWGVCVVHEYQPPPISMTGFGLRPAQAKKPKVAEPLSDKWWADKYDRWIVGVIQ